MKRLKKFVALLAAAAICVLVPGANVLTASAAEPVTYHVKYTDDGWEFQTGEWSNDGYNRDPYYMLEEIKDGDIVVIDSCGSGETAEFAFSKRLSNLTVVQNSNAVISAPAIDLCFVLAGSTAAVTGDVGEAFLYDNVAVSFHSNVNKLNMIDTQGQLNGSVTVDGTVAHVVSKTATEYIYYQLHNVAAGKLKISWGELKTDAAYFSTTATQPSVQAPATQTTQPSASVGEYDDVPKTGESNIILWLVGVAALCLAGKQALKRM